MDFNFCPEEKDLLRKRLEIDHLYQRIKGAIERGIVYMSMPTRREEIYAIMEALFNQILNARKDSQMAYAPDPQEPFENFEEEAEEFGLSPEMVLMQRAQKHWKYLVRWVRSTPQVRAEMEKREKIFGRIEDLVLYLALFDAMIREPNTSKFMDNPPCHKLPRSQWCDRDGPGGFMGHTCHSKQDKSDYTHHLDSQ